MDDEDEVEVEVVSYSWQLSHVVADTLRLAAAQARAIADHMETVAERASANHNQGVDDAAFQMAAALEIETITKEQ